MPATAVDRIAMGARSQSRFIMLALAEMLKERCGSEIHIYCGGPQELEFYNAHNSKGLFASINIGGDLYSHAFDEITDEAAVYRQAHDFEKKIGLTINHLLVPDRHFGRGYALGGYFHPRSRQSELTSYPQVVNCVCKTLAYWEQEFASKKITLVLNGTREMAHISRSMGIPYRALAGSRVRNLHFWATTEMYETPVFEAAWNSPAQFPEITLDRPYDTHLASRAHYQAMFSFGVMIKSLARTAAQFAYWRARGYMKAKGYYLTDTLRYHWLMWRDYKRLKALATTKLADLKGQPFVYFPLHVEPETALHGFSPEYFYQHAAVAAISRDLPAGVRLAVKEAYGAIGRRPSEFYAQMADLKNVVLLDVWEVGLACAQKADAVVTICGTAGLEAAVAGTPVIAFGKHNIYNFLPCVRVIHDEADLPAFLRDALDGTIASATIQAQGRRLLGAIVAHSFDLGSYDYINVERFEPSVVDHMFKALVEGLCDTGAVSGHVEATA